jgi:hypothetical protein
LNSWLPGDEIFVAKAKLWLSAPTIEIEQLERGAGVTKPKNAEATAEEYEELDASPSRSKH